MLHNKQGALVVLVSELHLRPAAVDIGQLIKRLISQLSSLVVYQIRILQVLIFMFIELCETNPYFARFTEGLLRINGSNGLCIGFNG